MMFKKVLLASAIMSALGSGSCFASELIEQTINNLVAAQQPEQSPSVVGQQQGIPQPTLPSQQGVASVQQQPFVAPVQQEQSDNSKASVVGVLADKTNPFTGEPMTVEDRKNILSAVTLDAQILEKQLEVAKKTGELKILPARIDNELAVASGGSGAQGGQPAIDQQLMMQQQNNEAEIEFRVQEGVRKAQLEKDYEIQTLKQKLQQKRVADSKMTLNSVADVLGQKIAIIRVGDKDQRVKEGGMVSGWAVSRIDTNSRSVTLSQRGRNVTLDMKKSVSQITTSKSSTGASGSSYDNGDSPITPDLPNALPLPKL
ncbi:hypothetical protein ACTG16_23685 [Aeromonas sp. 23P]|uniref:hypothetical protein n=1 Tax=Aeromonas sp. 23P TaxID=3452716 RepID=UPI003F78FE6B|nr:hypothetical protein [Aeromonas veronii]